MSESKEHKREKAKAAGKYGKQEVLLKSGRRLDAQNEDTAIEVQRNNSKVETSKALSRLMESKKGNKELRVPKKDLPKVKKTAENLFVRVRAIKK